jgi:hypothetical protein
MASPQAAAETVSPDPGRTAPNRASLPRVAWRFGERWLRPSLFDVLLIAVPFWFFSLAEGGLGLLLADGDTGWHIRTGQWILEQGRFVHRDLFSFTKPGEPWFAWEWLADVIWALLHQAGGVQAVALFGMVAGVAFCGIVFRHILWQGANLWIALPLAFACFGAATLHLLARPHLFTMVLLPAAAWWIEADRKQPGRMIWLMAPLAALWANLHGGWPALIAILGLAAAGSAAEAAAGTGSWAAARRYAWLTALCLAATLLNPYGWRLHAHIFQYLQADYIRNLVGEFRAPSFRGEPMLHYELALLAGVAASGVMLLRRQFVAPLWILFWAHASLQSARHIPLFIGVAMPFVGAELQRLWTDWAERGGRRSPLSVLSALAREAAPELKRVSVWPAAIAALVLLRAVPFPYFDDFPAERFPRSIVERRQAEFAGARIFTADQWADYLIYRLWPRVKVFFDGRSDFYGRDIAEEYLRAMEGRPGWEAVLEKYRFDTVLVSPQTALASLLKISPGWRLVEDDGKAVLFRRRGPAAQQTASVPPHSIRNPALGPNEIP